MDWRRWFHALPARLRAIVRPSRFERELDDELSFHVAMQTQANVKRGMSESEAERRARLALGGVDQTTERSRDVRPLQWAHTFIQDVRYALRSLRRTPSFTAVALLTLALGIGANAAMFSIVNGVLLRPLPYPDADRLVRIYQANPGQGIRNGAISLTDFGDWRERTRSFRAMAAYQRISVILTGRGDPTELRSAFVTGEFFDVLRAPAQLGRPLLPEDVRGASYTAVISDRLWRTAFAADRAIIGQSVLLQGQPYTVVGVMPADFRFPTADTDAWAPYSVLSELQVGPRVRIARVMEGVARLGDDMSLERARAELNAVAAQLAAEYPQSNARWSAATVVPLRTVILGDVDRALVVVLAVVAFILLIGCANLANLLLARGASRSNEIAVRVALGAERVRIVRQLLTESLVLACLGGTLGIVLAVWGVDTILALGTGTLPRLEDVRIDGRVTGFGLLLSLTTGLLFGLLPALRATAADPQNNLKGGRGTVGRGHRVRSALVVVEVSLAVVLVIGAALMARSFLALRGVDPGFDRGRILTVTLQYNVVGVDGADIPSHLVGRRDEITKKIAALPDVLDVGTVNSLPLQAEIWEPWEFARMDGGGPADAGVLRADGSYISPRYLQTMGIPLLRGEPLPEQLDFRSGAPIPMLISETAARRFWPDRDPVGQTVQSLRGGFKVLVSGIVGDVRHRRLAEELRPAVYFPHAMGLRIVTTFVVRSAGNPQTLAAPIRQAIKQLDPNQPIRAIATMSGVMAESIARDRFFTVLYGLFGGLALVLAAVGVYGVLSYSVGQRTQEIGVRMALGAHAADILRMIVGGGMLLALGGVAIGTLSSLWLTRVLKSQLHGVSTTDPIAFVAAPAVLIAVALLACYVPARRAMRIDPIAALRDE
jgi:predicted permease